MLFKNFEICFLVLALVIAKWRSRKATLQYIDFQNISCVSNIPSLHYHDDRTVYDINKVDKDVEHCDVVMTGIIEQMENEEYVYLGHRQYSDAEED